MNEPDKNNEPATASAVDAPCYMTDFKVGQVVKKGEVSSLSQKRTRKV